jgi:hypothetical protein
MHTCTGCWRVREGGSCASPPAPDPLQAGKAPHPCQRWHAGRAISPYNNSMSPSLEITESQHRASIPHVSTQHTRPASIHTYLHAELHAVVLVRRLLACLPVGSAVRHSLRSTSLDLYREGDEEVREGWGCHQQVGRRLGPDPVLSAHKGWSSATHGERAAPGRLKGGLRGLLLPGPLLRVRADTEPRDSLARVLSLQG